MIWRVDSLKVRRRFVLKLFGVCVFTFYDNKILELMIGVYKLFSKIWMRLYRGTVSKWKEQRTQEMISYSAQLPYHLCFSWKTLLHQRDESKHWLNKMPNFLPWWTNQVSLSLLTNFHNEVPRYYGILIQKHNDLNVWEWKSNIPIIYCMEMS